MLLTHAATLFPVFVADVHKRDLREIGPFVIGHLHAELGQEGIGPEALGALDHGSVRLARTASRSVLSVMNDSASHIRFHVEQEGGLAAVDLDALNHRLRRTLHGRDGDYVVPLDLAAERAVGRRSSVESVQRIEPRRLRSSDDADSQP